MPKPQKVEIDELNPGEYYFIECYAPGYADSQGMLLGKFEKKLDNLNSMPGWLQGLRFSHGPYAEFSGIKIKRNSTSHHPFHQTKYFSVYQPNKGGYKFYTKPSEQIRQQGYIIESKEKNTYLPRELGKKIMEYAPPPPTSLGPSRKTKRFGGRNHRRSRRKHKRKTNKKRKNVTHKRKSRSKGVKRRSKLA